MLNLQILIEFKKISFKGLQIEFLIKNHQTTYMKADTKEFFFLFQIKDYVELASRIKNKQFDYYLNYYFFLRYFINIVNYIKFNIIT